MIADHQGNGANGEDDLLRLHNDVVSGSETAREQLASLLVFNLYKSLSYKYASDRLDRDIIWDGVTAALLHYCGNPDSFDPSLGVPLPAYLRRLADWNIRKARRSAERRRKREQTAAELPDSAFFERSESIECTDPEPDLWICAVELLRRDRDRAVLIHWLAGETRTGVLARLLGFSGATAEVQRRQVKRAKDRILKTLQRNLTVRTLSLR